MHHASTRCVGKGRRLTLLESLRQSTAVAGDVLTSPSTLELALKESKANSAVTSSQSQPGRPLLLKNKLPRWNAGAIHSPLPGIQDQSVIILKN